MSQSTHPTSTNKGRKLSDLFRGNKVLIDEVADAGVCNQIALDLHELRNAKGLTQKEFANLLGVQQSNVSRWEQVGYQGYKVKMLSKAARALGGRLTVSLVPPSDVVATVVSFKQTLSDKQHTLHADGTYTLHELNTSQEACFVDIKMSGIGVQNEYI